MSFSEYKSSDERGTVIAPVTRNTFWLFLHYGEGLHSVNTLPWFCADSDLLKSLTVTQLLLCFMPS